MQRQGTCCIAYLVVKKMKECEINMEFLGEEIFARGMDGGVMDYGGLRWPTLSLAMGKPIHDHSPLMLEK